VLLTVSYPAFLDEDPFHGGHPTGQVHTVCNVIGVPAIGLDTEAAPGQSSCFSREYIVKCSPFKAKKDPEWKRGANHLMTR
jgi:hypothetical protein